MGIYAYCRIDARLHCESKKEFDCLLSKKIPLENLFFLEINSMPTIKNNINFHTSMDALKKEHSIFACYEIYKNIISKPTHTGFILSCSMLSASITKH